jgi:hypothetical protein
MRNIERKVLKNDEEEEKTRITAPPQKGRKKENERSR